MSVNTGEMQRIYHTPIKKHYKVPEKHIHSVKSHHILSEIEVVSKLNFILSKLG